MKRDSKKTQQCEISPFVPVGPGELSARGNGNPQDHDSHGKAQPDNCDGRRIDQGHLGGTYQNYVSFG